MKHNENSSKIGTVYLLLGASGSGKTTLANTICASNHKFVKVIYSTTRQRRENEIHGKDYYFLTNNEFDEMNKQGQFKYVYQCHDNYYGIPIEIESIIGNGYSIMLGLSRKLLCLIYRDFPKVKCIYLDINEKDSIHRMYARDSHTTDKDAIIRINSLNNIKNWASNVNYKFDCIIPANITLTEKIDIFTAFISTSEECD